MKFSTLQLTTPYLQLAPLFYDRVSPTPLEKPFLISVSNDAAKLLGVDEELSFDEKLFSIVNGEKLLEGSEPFAFLDDYEKDYVCNHTDRDGRYSFSNQPSIGHWNLTMLARALSPIVNYESALEVLDKVYGATYAEVYSEIMYAKMGLETEQENDKELFQWMLGALGSATIDYTEFFRRLSHFDGDKSKILDICVYRSSLEEWLESYEQRLDKERLSTQECHEKMLKVNPKYILKNHILQEAIQKAVQKDFSMVHDLLQVAHSPFEEHPELEYLAKRAPIEAKNIKLSCSS